MTRRPTFRTPLLALSLCAPALLEAQAARLPAAAQVRRVADSLARAFIAHNDAPGTAIAIVRGTDTLLFHGYGSANLELGVPVAVTSVFRVGSVTKQFTASAVMQLVEIGTLSLADSIGQWVPNLPATWRPITITQLLNHTSGIPSYTEAGESWMKRWGEEMTGADIVALTADKPFDFAPGTSWKYNNTGYVLLGMLLEARMGHGWGDEFTRRFFTSLGMTRTRYCEVQPLIAGRAAGYSRNEKDEWVNARYLAMSQPAAAGALCSTIGDMLTWNRALHGGTVVTPASYTAMTTPAGSAVPRGYGFGLGVDSVDGHRVISHSGGIPGALTANMWVPEAQLSVTVLTNGDFRNPDPLAKQLVRAALGLPLDVPPRGVTLTAAALASYTGEFDVTIDGPHVFKIYVQDGKLYGMMDVQTPELLIPLGNDTFAVTFNKDVRLTITMDGGKAAALTFGRPDSVGWTGKRKP
ncbi:MAG: beta-lactamase family protein [Gemmatimonadaceae bacterium]|nr:beta-lactamase family protein [Gemmatimonadaceae bacterium]